MTDATTQFFSQLAQRGSEPLLKNVTGTLRFDLAGGKRAEHWHVTIDKGAVAVSRENADADTVLRVDKALFDKFARGEANAMAAVLRGEVKGEGDLELPVRFQRLFPGPSGPSGQGEGRAS
jgi:putative sterol carrier protein